MQRVIFSKLLKPSVVLFIHGSPGSSVQFLLSNIPQNIMQKTNSSVMLIDRIGYGYSEFGNTQISIFNTAKRVMNVINHFKNINDLTIIGYSYGGPIAACVASEHKISTLILISASVKPNAERVFWFNKLLNRKYFKAIIPDAWLVANAEKLNHAKQLKEIEGIWEKLSMKIICVHGRRDKLIHLDNLIFVKNKTINTCNLKIEIINKAKHNLLWDYPNNILNLIIAESL